MADTFRNCANLVTTVACCKCLVHLFFLEPNVATYLRDSEIPSALSSDIPPHSDWVMLKLRDTPLRDTSLLNASNIHDEPGWLVPSFQCVDTDWKDAYNTWISINMEFPETWDSSIIKWDSVHVLNHLFWKCLFLSITSKTPFLQMSRLSMISHGNLHSSGRQVCV